MTTIPVNDDNPRAQYVASSGQTSFVYDWFIFIDDDLDVYVDGVLQIISTDYTVTGANTENGGTVIFVVARVTGEIITIEGNVAIERQVDLQQAGRFDPDEYNLEQDKNIVIMKQLKRDLDRAVTLPVDSSLVDVSLPLPAPNRLLGWNAAADALENKVAATSVLPEISSGDANNLLQVNATETGYDSVAPEGVGIISTASTESRSLANRFSDITNVKDLGAVGDNVTDDLLAFNSALSAGNSIFIPYGTYRLSAMPNFNGHHIEGNGSTLIIDDVHQATINSIDIKYCSDLTIEGKTTHSTTISSINGVTGSAGNWSVQSAVADASNIIVGDVVLVRDTRPSSGDVNEFSGRPVFGQMDETNAKIGKLSAIGTAVSFVSGDATTVFNVGDLIVAKSQVRKITSILALSGVVDSAFAGDFSAIDAYYSLQSATGTVSCVGTAITGIGTAFATESNIGDLIVVNGQGIGSISTINSDTSITLDISMGTFSATEFGVNTLGEAHDGAWVVSAVSGSLVTWINKCRTKQPPINNIISGNINIVKTVITAGAGLNGVILQEGALNINKLALVGDGITAGNEGVELRQENASITLGNLTGVLNFGYNIRVSKGNSVEFTGGYSSGAVTRCVDITVGGLFQGRDCIISASNGVGIMVSFNSFAELSFARIFCNALQGIRQEADSAVVAEYCNIVGNGDDGVLTFGTANFHYVGCRFIRNGDYGVQVSNGGRGRFSGSLFVANIDVGLHISQANIEAGKIQVIGNGSAGVIAIRSTLSLENSSVGFNVNSQGLRNLGSIIRVDSFQSVSNLIGIYCEDSGKISGSIIACLNNSSSDIQCVGNEYATIHLNSVVGSPVYSPAVNVCQSDGGGFITDGSADFLFNNEIVNEAFSPAWGSVVVSSYSVQVGRYTKDRLGNVTAEVELSWSGLDTADSSSMNINLPVALANASFISGNIDLQASTGVTFGATDTISFGSTGATTIVVLTDSSGSTYRYNSGKIAASGVLKMILQYKA